MLNGLPIINIAGVFDLITGRSDGPNILKGSNDDTSHFWGFVSFIRVGKKRGILNENESTWKTAQKDFLRQYFISFNPKRCGMFSEDMDNSKVKLRKGKSMSNCTLNYFLTLAIYFTIQKVFYVKPYEGCNNLTARKSKYWTPLSASTFSIPGGVG